MVRITPPGSVAGRKFGAMTCLMTSREMMVSQSSSRVGAEDQTWPEHALTHRFEGKVLY